MEKKKKGGVTGTVVAAGVALLIAGSFGFGNGGGFGLGEAQPAVSNQVVEQTDETSVNAETEQARAVVIEVKQDEYIVDGKTMSLNDIEVLIHQVDMYNASFALVDNYASAKAWDEVMGLLVGHGISVVEQ